MQRFERRVQCRSNRRQFVRRLVRHLDQAFVADLVIGRQRFVVHAAAKMDEAALL